jgi:predicted dehydrogenase
MFAEDLRLLPDAALVAVCSRDQLRAADFGRRFGVKHAHTSVLELAQNHDVDVIYIATPHVRHRVDCLACFAGGKPVLCEKPFTLNAHEAREVIAGARSHQLFCMEAMWMRFQPLIIRVRSLVQSGMIGQVRLLQADLGYRTPFDPDGRFFSRALGGGVLLDRGVYLLSLAFFLLGQPEAAAGRASIGPTGVDEQMAALLTYPAGALAVLTASLRSRQRNEALIIGAQGQVRIHEPFFAPRRVSLATFTEPAAIAAPDRSALVGWLSQVKRHPAARRVYDRIAGPVLRLMRRQCSQLEHYTSGHGYQYEAAEVMRCLRAGERESPLQTLDETLAVLEAMDGLRRSWDLTYPGEPG